jgi:hypothetical protein
MHKLFIIMFLLIATTAMAQQIDLRSLDKLADKAEEKVEINVDEGMLKSAPGFLSEKDRDEAAVKKATEGLKGIFGRVYEFGKAGSYQRSDLDPIRNQLKNPQWKVFTSIRDKSEEVEIWMHSTGNQVDGMLLLVAGSNELVVLNIVGSANLSDLAKIGAQFGVNIDAGPKK